MKILIVEDEAGIVRFLERGLRAHGYTVVSAETGEDGLREALESEAPVELVLLDISLPGMGGHELLKRLRARRPNLPVLMLTARDDVRNKVGALDAGADDYLTKPFVFEELLARIRALRRRADQQRASELRSGPLRVDLLGRRAWVGERKVELSSREFALLEYLMRHPGQALSRQQILSAVWGYDFDPGSNVVDVYIRYLRGKIDRPEGPSFIQTVRGAGYRFEPPSAPPQASPT